MASASRSPASSAQWQAGTTPAPPARRFPASAAANLTTSACAPVTSTVLPKSAADLTTTDGVPGTRHAMTASGQPDAAFFVRQVVAVDVGGLSAASKAV